MGIDVADACAVARAPIGELGVTNGLAQPVEVADRGIRADAGDDIGIARSARFVGRFLRASHALSNASRERDCCAGIGRAEEEQVAEPGAGGQAGLAACCATGDAVEVRIVEAPGAGSGEGDLHRRSAGLH